MYKELTIEVWNLPDVTEEIPCLIYKVAPENLYDFLNNLLEKVGKGYLNIVWESRDAITITWRDYNEK